MKETRREYQHLSSRDGFDELHCMHDLGAGNFVDFQLASFMRRVG